MWGTNAENGRLDLLDMKGQQMHVGMTTAELLISADDDSF